MMSLAQLDDATDIVSRGYLYWCEKAHGQIAPKWADIDPAEIVELLSHIVVIHVLREPLDFVERITGQTIIENSFRNGMHICYRDFDGRGPGSAIWAIMETVTIEKKPSFQQVPYVGPNQDFLQLQTVVCPISDDRLKVNKLLAFVDFLYR